MVKEIFERHYYRPFYEPKGGQMLGQRDSTSGGNNQSDLRISLLRRNSRPQEKYRKNWLYSLYSLSYIMTYDDGRHMSS
jgi:hypothetical protein